ncbi:MAG: von Willebrand factor type A domain-containing protein, partial [Candidatus Omnitrophica bacterium]|nr:von Willebrand factor type A domain-containing protein [Candidatus Omnitrophota bacterium]
MHPANIFNAVILLALGAVLLVSCGEAPSERVMSIGKADEQTETRYNDPYSQRKYSEGGAAGEPASALQKGEYEDSAQAPGMKEAGKRNQPAEMKTRRERRSTDWQPAPVAEPARIAPPAKAPERPVVVTEEKPYPGERTAVTRPDEFFKSYGVNPFVETLEDNLSTFAIDVDKASYAIARKYLDRGYLPPKQSVRTEEFINYFRYYYKGPSDEAFAIYIEGAPSVFGAPGQQLLKIGIKGREVRKSERKNVILTFVIDVSGSMAREDRLGLVKKALRLLVDELTVNDRVGIAIYGSTGRIILDPTSIANKDRIVSAIESLQSGGSTNAEQGIMLGYQMAQKAFESGKINRVILCSDGVAN